MANGPQPPQIEDAMPGESPESSRPTAANGATGATMLGWITHSAGVLVVLFTVLAAAAPRPVMAQSCSSDSQCYDFGRPRTYCAGNTLVTKQSICAGTCRSVEISRVPCPGPCVADRCVGGSLRSGPLPPPGGGGSFVAGVCGKICSCKGKVLTYGVGFAKRAADCRIRKVDCVYGCSCDGEPRCLKRGEVSN